MSIQHDHTVTRNGNRRKNSRKAKRLRTRKRIRRILIVLACLLILVFVFFLFCGESNFIRKIRSREFLSRVPNVILMGEPKVVMSNPNSKLNYFGWPSICRLQNDTIAVVASGYRTEHIDPLGQCVISYSYNEGKSYTAPAPILDTVLDDRDSGILAYGENNVIVTTFNNTVAFQRGNSANPFYNSYLDMITPSEEAEALGSLYSISNDGGITFGEIRKSPITSPHGPCELSDGTLLWVGTLFESKEGEPSTQAYTIAQDGSMTKIGEIQDVPDYACHEPYAIEAEDGTIICHIRVQPNPNSPSPKFTIYQSESTDSGKTWTTPHQILEDTGGAPSHILKHSSGVLIATYGVRHELNAIKAMFSYDNGKTWMTDYLIYDNNGVSSDIGYPASIELNDGSLLTVFYAHPTAESSAVIMQQKWRF